MVLYATVLLNFNIHYTYFKDKLTLGSKINYKNIKFDFSLRFNNKSDITPTLSKQK